MSSADLLLRALDHGERRLERDLLATADRHRRDPEVHHVAKDLARWSCDNTARIADLAPHYGLNLPGSTDVPPRGGLPASSAADEDALAFLQAPDLLILRDLFAVHLAASGNSLYWETLAQFGKATKDSRLSDLAAACHPQTLRQIRWTTTMIKTLSPQALSSR